MVRLIESFLTNFLQNTDNSSDAIEHPPTHYTIKYTDALTGESCGLARLSASECIAGVCRHHFETSTSRCHPLSDMNITVSATNVFGEGQNSVPTTIGKSTPVTCNLILIVYFSKSKLSTLTTSNVFQ